MLITFIIILITNTTSSIEIILFLYWKIKQIFLVDIKQVFYIQMILLLKVFLLVLRNYRPHRHCCHSYHYRDYLYFQQLKFLDHVVQHLVLLKKEEEECFSEKGINLPSWWARYVIRGCYFHWFTTFSGSICSTWPSYRSPKNERKIKYEFDIIQLSLLVGTVTISWH